MMKIEFMNNLKLIYEDAVLSEWIHFIFQNIKLSPVLFLDLIQSDPKPYATASSANKFQAFCKIAPFCE